MSHAFEEALEDFTKVSDQFKPKAGAKTPTELYERAKSEYAGKLDKDELTKFLRLVLPIGDMLDKEEQGIAGIITDKALHEVRSYAILSTYLVNHSDEPQEAAGPFAFGFGPRAIPGVEQFFESRYQSYRYLVHHRTASRSNVLVELLLQKLYEFAYRFPESGCAMVMDRLGFIRREQVKKKWRLTEILPDPGENGEDLDDASLRVLMKRCRSILRKPGNFERLTKTSKECGRRAREIDTLIEIILNRSLQHTFTLFKDETVDGFLSKRLGLTEQNEQQGFFAYVVDSGLGSMLNDLNKDLARASSISKSGKKSGKSRKRASA